MRGGRFGLAALVVLAACGDEGPPALRQMSNSYSYTISPDDSPPHARQDIHYVVQIFDRKTRQPIDNGEGQLFASNNQGAKTWDGMTYGPEELAGHIGKHAASNSHEPQNHGTFEPR